MAFLRSTWYAALWAKDLGPKEILSRKFLDEPVVLYRKPDGGVTALRDVCPHRHAPLHLGVVRDDGNLQCGYHGLEFDESGTCVRNPHGSGRIPAQACVRAYPVVERHSLIWIWMGEQAADPGLIPEFSILDPESGYQISRRDWLLMEANYELITDNLLDLSHTAFLHEGILGSEETIKADLSMEQNGDQLKVNRLVPDCPVPGFFDMMYKRNNQKIDLWADIRWDPPGCMMNDTGVTDPGAPRSQGTGIYGTHFLTPETDRTTYYLFAAARMNPVSWGEPLDTEIQEKVADLRRYAFEHQDQVMIRGQQRVMDELPADEQPVLLEIDSGPTRYRRILEKLMRAENEAVAAE